MAKPKAQTIQQKFGFLDEDLKKPKHDEIMKWLYANVEKKLATWLDIYPTWPEDMIAECIESVKWTHEERRKLLEKQLRLAEEYVKTQESKNHWERDTPPSYSSKSVSEIKNSLQLINNWLLIPPPPPPKQIIYVSDKKWEHPIIDKKTNWVVGFIDLAVKYSVPYLEIPKGIKYDAKFPDDNWKPEWHIYQPERWIYFEVKTEIKSLGELIRQINLYRQYIKTDFFVVSPDDSDAEILEEQDIGFIKYELS